MNIHGIFFMPLLEMFSKFRNFIFFDVAFAKDPAFLKIIKIRLFI